MVSKHLANLKHPQFFAEILLKADRLYEKGGSNVEVGLRLFDVNWKNIELGQEWAAQQAGTDVNAATLTSEYPDLSLEMAELARRSAEINRTFPKEKQKQI
jgi:hypothetical protein